MTQDSSLTENATDSTVSDAAQQQPEPAVALPPDPIALAAETKTAFPNMDQRALEILYVCSISFASRKGKQNAPSPEMAARKLALVKGWTDQDIRDAILSLMNGVQEGLGALVEGFLTATIEPGDTVPAEFDFQLFAGRLQKEQAQQHDRILFAQELITLVMNLSGKLGIPNPDVAVQAVSQTPAQKETEGRFASISKQLRGIAGQFVSISDRKQNTQPADEVENYLSWTTPAILTGDDKDVETVKFVIADEANNSTDPREIWANLNALGLNQSDVEGYLRRVAEKSREEIEQSRSILKRVETEYGEYAFQLEAYKRLRDVIEGIIDFNPSWGPDAVRQDETR